MPLKADFSLAVLIHTKLMEYKIGILLFLSLEHFWRSNFTNIDPGEHVRHYGLRLALMCELNHYEATTNTLKAESDQILNFGGFKLYLTKTQDVVLSKASDFQL